MSDIMIPTIEELTKRRMESLAVSEKAIIQHPDEYRRIKKLVRQIIAKPLDIGDYFKTAKELSKLLKKMAVYGRDSIFHYYYDNIDPQRNGQARYLRALCLDLEQQLQCIDHMRHRKRNLKLVQ